MLFSFNPTAERSVHPGASRTVELSAEELIEKNLFQYSLEDLYSIIADNKALSAKLADNPSLFENMLLQDIVKMGLSVEEVALKLLECRDQTFLTSIESDSVRAKISINDLLLFGKKYENIALALLANKDLCDQLSGENLALLGQSNENVAMTILKRADLMNRLLASDSHAGYNLAILGAGYESIALAILKDVKLRAKFTTAQKLVDMVGDEHENVVIEYLTDETIRAKLLGTNDSDVYNSINSLDSSLLTKWAMISEKVALFILSDPLLKQRFQGDKLEVIGEKYENIALEIIKDSTLRSKLYAKNLATMGGKHQSVALIILENDELRRKIVVDPLSDSPNWLGELGRHCATLGFSILGNSELKDSLLGDELVALSNSHVNVAMAIIKDPMLKLRLSSSHLAILGINNAQVAHAIIEDSNLTQRISSNFLVKIGMKHQTVAEAIIRNKTLRDKLSTSEIVSLGEAHESVALNLIDNNDINMDLSQLAALTKNHSELGHTLLKRSATQEPSTDRGIFYRLLLAKANESVAFSLLADNKLTDVMPYSEFEQLALSHEKVALAIMKTPKLKDKLTKFSQGEIYNKYDNVALHALNDDELRKSLSLFQLLHVGSKYESAALIIQRHELISPYSVNDEPEYKKLKEQARLAEFKLRIAKCLHVTHPLARLDKTSSMSGAETIDVKALADSLALRLGYQLRKP